MKTKCPYCNYVATEHETLDNQRNPMDEEISFCINCGETSMFKNKSLIKFDVGKLDDEVKFEIANIRTAWVKTKGSNYIRKNNSLIHKSRLNKERFANQNLGEQE